MTPSQPAERASWINLGIALGTVGIDPDVSFIFRLRIQKHLDGFAAAANEQAEFVWTTAGEKERFLHFDFATNRGKRAQTRRANLVERLGVDDRLVTFDVLLV